MGILTKQQIRQLIKENNLKDVKDVQQVLKDMFADTLQEMLEAEMDDELGYTKYDYKNKKSNNSRNGHSQKTVTSDYGDIELDIPRDRQAEFEPKIVKKHQRDVSGIEDQILSMYAKGMTTRDIQDHLNNLYGMDVSPTLISNITDKILPLVKEWQNRPLEDIYAVVFMDAVHFKVREEGHVINKAAYVAIGIDLDGQKDVLGLWIGENESAKYWLNILNELNNRGVKDILIACIDGLTGFTEAINAAFPQTEVQKCIIHQIRNSTRYVGYKDRKAFTSDLKNIYQAVNEETAWEELDRFEEKWGAKYAIAINSWRRNWSELSTFFKYPAEIRKIIYTTNTIESYNRQLRKVTKSKSIFPTDDALQKMLYLATMDIMKKWTTRIRGWAAILSQLSIYFADRLEGHID
ncbi:MAG: IS256 family transposase [Syntrophomonadaceae bacterium]|nr:IS256 family transposase [Syntrophomonadaceae bacterium]